MLDLEEDIDVRILQVLPENIVKSPLKRVLCDVMDKASPCMLEHGSNGCL